MNITNFTQTGGFPLKSERLQELQTAYSIFNSLGAMAGNLTIISGCELVGTTIGNGFVYINEELLEFREGTVTESSTVIIVEQPVNREFENAEIKTVYTIRYATFGTADTSWAWTAFKRLDPVTQLMLRLDTLEKKTAVFQSGGGMVLWNKPAIDIPTGWQEVVDWRGRMPVGFDNTQGEFNTMGKTGGAKNKTLSIAEMPSHSHAIGNARRNSGGGSGGDENHPKSYAGSRDHITDSQGGGQEFSLLNPYRVVLFIEYIG
jgi:hypothetical protein